MWRRRAATLRVRRYNVLSVSATLCASLCASVVLCAAASEERALRQALTIVQLLRAEFGRLIQPSTETPAPTCAPTTAILLSHSGPSRRHWTTWYGEPAPQRRLDYEEGFGAHPSSVVTPKPFTSHPSTSASELSTSYSQNNPTHSSTKSSSDAANTLTQSSSAQNHSASPTTSNRQSAALSSSKTISLDTSISTETFSRNLELTTLQSTDSKSTRYTELYPKSIPATVLQSSTKLVSADTVITPQSIVQFVTLQASSLTKPEAATQTPKKLSVWTKPAHVIETPAPELQQVAEELAGELEESGVDRSAKVKLTAVSKHPVARASWREHLARSTRYAVPLPENHAFCYTDPRNALCRTFI